MLVCICSTDCRRLSNPGSCISDTKRIGSKMKIFASFGYDTFNYVTSNSNSSKSVFTCCSIFTYRHWVW